jgi:succinate-semialdehyde dehydrogenase/glutarate-semialdehyde dehydrogenase
LEELREWFTNLKNLVMYQSINPVNQKQFATFKTFDHALVEKKVESANTAYQYWKDLPVKERAQVIEAFADLFESKKQSLGKLMSMEMGKPLSQSIAEVEKCVLLCRYTASKAEEFLAPQSIQTENHKEAYLLYQPIGAVLGVMPWNYPYWQALRFGIPALLAGNVIFLKPAPNVPQCGLEIEKAFKEVFPAHSIFQTMLLDNDQVAELIEEPLLQGIALTGSEGAGAAVASKAASEIKKAVLELGGSDAFVVLKDADLEKAAEVAVKSRMNNSGQTCIAAKRFIVEEAIADEFTIALKNNYARLNWGDPFDEDTDIGPLARKDLLDKLSDQLNETIQAGAEVLVSGGKVEGSEGNFFRPVLLTGVKEGMRAYEEELFGPVGVLYIEKDLEAAIKRANDTRYGLGAAVWTEDLEKAKMVASRIEAGAIAINEMVKSDPKMPFGGIKRSGFGREMAKEGIHEFVNIKTVIVG